MSTQDDSAAEKLPRQSSEWLSFSLPPLRLKKDDLPNLVALAGEGAEVANEDRPHLEAVLRGPHFELELARHEATLRVDNASEKNAEAFVEAIRKPALGRHSILLPISVGAALGGALFAAGVRTDVGALVAMGAMLVGILLNSRLRGASEPATTVAGESGERWRTTVPLKPLGFHDLPALMRSLGAEATLEFSSDAEGPLIQILSPGVAVILRQEHAVVTYENSAMAFEPLYEALLQHRKPLWRLTHGDFSLLAGMALPLAAYTLAPEAAQHTAVLASVAPWLGYAVWVQRNQSRRWCIVR